MLGQPLKCGCRQIVAISGRLCLASGSVLVSVFLATAGGCRGVDVSILRASV